MQPLLDWKSNKYYIFWVCVCSLMYPACNAHAPYCQLWPVRLYNIFPHFLINGKISGKKRLLNIKKKCFDFLYNFCPKYFDSNKRWATHDNKYVLVFTQSTRYSCQILMEHEFSGQIFERYSNIKFRGNPSSGSRVVPRRRTDMTKLTVAFRNYGKGA